MTDGIMEDVNGTDRASQRISSWVAAKDLLETIPGLKPPGPFKLINMARG